MEKITIGIEKRVQLSVLEQALRAALDGTASPAYFMELALSGCTGQNRAKKTVALLNRLTVKSRLYPYLTRHSETVLNMLRSNYDKPLLFAAMMCASYSLFYDTVSILGKYFHVQGEVSRAFLLHKLSEKYGGNRTLEVAFDCVMPMLIDAGLVGRDVPGVYTLVRQSRYSEAASAIYKEAFLLNNPTLSEKDEMDSYPYFEFIR